VTGAHVWRAGMGMVGKTIHLYEGFDLRWIRDGRLSAELCAAFLGTMALLSKSGIAHA
jgi:hypothetical protein